MSSSADTSDRIVTPPGRSSPSLGWRHGLVAFVTVALIGLLLGAALIKLDYFAFKPGSVRDTGSLIDVSGAETYPPEGEISYTTVSLERATALEILSGWLDPDIDIQPTDKVLGDRDVEENRRFNQALMNGSQEVATQVAMEWLGYEVESIAGEVVVEVIEGTPAEGVLEPGDTIVAVDGERLDEPDDRERLLGAKVPGDSVTLTIKPFTETTEEEVSLVLAPAPDDPARGRMGVGVQPTGVEYPVDVSFDTGEVGGPSAGLALTLGLIEVLTPGSLTGGASVAVTGTIEPDATVGPIGGAGQKAAAVREAGYDAFLVPSADYEAAQDHAGDVEVVEVDSLDEALEALEELGGDAVAAPDAAGAAAGDDDGDDQAPTPAEESPTESPTTEPSPTEPPPTQPSPPALAPSRNEIRDFRRARGRRP